MFVFFLLLLLFQIFPFLLSFYNICNILLILYIKYVPNDSRRKLTRYKTFVTKISFLLSEIHMSFFLNDLREDNKTCQ